MKYPEYARIGGEQYKINTGYEVALRCFEVIDDPDISGEERALAVIYLLFGVVPQENANAFLTAANKFLSCGKEPDSDGPPRGVKDMDFVFDEDYIRASFMSDYKIDLSREPMHFWNYVTLVRGLTENCILSRVRDIRNYDLSEIKDHKLRTKIVDAKMSVELPRRRSQEELNAIDEFEALFS